jgi:PAS domain-containing protein
MDGSFGSSSPRNAQGHVKTTTHRGWYSPLDRAVEYQVILLRPESNSLGTSLFQQCQGLAHSCIAVETAEEACRRVSQSSRQTVVLVDISTNQIAVVERLVELIASHNLWLQATLVAIVADSNELTPEVRVQLVGAGFSRLLTEDQCSDSSLRLHLQLLECSELRVKQHLMYSQALQAAVDQSNDAIQIADSQSQIMYVNSSFVRLTGFSKEEALGRPASEMMKMIDVRSENGPFPSTQPLKVCPVT